MISKYECKEFNRNISEAYKHYAFRFKQIKQAYKENYIKSLAPGAMIPNDDFYRLDGEYRAEAEKLCSDTQIKVLEQLTRAKELIADEVTAAPTTDAVNIVSLLNMRADLKQEELDAIYTKYGDNVQIYKALGDIARKHDLNVNYENGLEEQNERIDNLIRNAKFINVYEAENNNQVADGFCLMRQMDIDAAFPTED